MTTVLVVDDEPTIRVLLRAVLEREGYHVLEAAEGAAGLRTAQRAKPDLVLLDIALPGLNGLEVARRLQADPATRGTPVLLLTGVLQPSERRVAEEAGAQGFIAKPFNPAALVAEVDRAVRRRPVPAQRN